MERFVLQYWTPERGWQDAVIPVPRTQGEGEEMLTHVRTKQPNYGWRLIEVLSS